MKNFEKYVLASALPLAVLIVTGCAASRKLSRLQAGTAPVAQIALSEKESYIPELKTEAAPARDTLKIVEDDGTEILLMKAVRDEETGEMVATDVIDAARVTARFRNVAERMGKVDLAFQVIVPESMMDSKWQLRFNPDLYILGDSTRLEPVIVTGAGYRKAQLRGYQQYERFLSKIVEDTTKFINVKQLEIFLRRNIPQIYSFKTDSSFVSDEHFQSCFGVTQRQAVEHYTNKFAKARNNSRIRRKAAMFRKYVKAPIASGGIRLDTVIVSPEGDFIYNYVQTINVRPKLRKADIVLSGDIFEQDKKIFTIPRSEPLTFYVSSVSAFLDDTERYMTKVVERRAYGGASARIEFEEGSAEVKQSLSDNYAEISRIRQLLMDLMKNETFDIDSIIVSATASPEGSYSFNERLAQRRSESVSSYFESYIKAQTDSLNAEAGMVVDMDGNWKAAKTEIPAIRFTPVCIPENWEDLEAAVLADKAMDGIDRKSFLDLCKESDPDERENLLKRMPYYKHIKEDLYPGLRVVKFTFHLHRKGMVKDTVQTTVIDTTYRNGVQALRDMDYAGALKRLRPYKDVNTAIAYLGMNMNESALSILEAMERTDKVNYMLAILYSRKGETEKAVECYVKSCRQNRSYVYRGNLDPEISVLIKMYNLNRDEEEY